MAKKGIGRVEVVCCAYCGDEFPAGDRCGSYQWQRRSREFLAEYGVKAKASTKSRTFKCMDNSYRTIDRLLDCVAADD